MSAPDAGPGPGVADDRAPIVLVLLDGLGDRPLTALGGRTPAEAAHVPNLARLAARGVSGVHLPFGPGRATASERSHWAMFGYGNRPFCGRSVLEALGAGQPVAEDAVVVQASLRTSTVRDGRVWITGRAARADADDARALLTAVGSHHHEGIGFTLDALPVGPTGDAVVRLHGDAVPDVTDSDPFFEDWHPWLRPLPHTEAADPAAARRTADALTGYLAWARRTLVDHEVNRRRTAAGQPPLDTLTTKWIGRRTAVPSLTERLGTRAAFVASTGLYAGFAALLGAHHEPVTPAAAPGEDMAGRLATAARLLTTGVGFIHVHTKATDEAGHTKDPRRKLDVLEAMDPAFALLHESPFRDAVVAVTGDHATPSRDSVLHSGDPTPFVAAGPTVHPDAVTAFGESAAAGGSLGALRADDVLPLLLGLANRSAFRGHRCTATDALGLPDDPVPMPPP